MVWRFKNRVLSEILTRCGKLGNGCPMTEGLTELRITLNRIEQKRTRCRLGDRIASLYLRYVVQCHQGLSFSRFFCFSFHHHHSHPNMALDSVRE